MYNDLYHWQAEQSVRYELREVDRAVEQARLLRDAGLTGGDWLRHAVTALRDILKTRGTGFLKQRSLERDVIPAKSSELCVNC
jgi:hypothetical protein